MYLKYRKNYFSQNGEDGIIEKLIEQLGLNHKLFLCEFGAWDGKFLSNIFNLIKKKNCVAIMIESDGKKFDDLLKTSKKFSNIIPIKRFIVPYGQDSLDAILEANKFPINYDILSIDIDSNDLEVWNNSKKFKPKIVIIEINSSIPPNVRQKHNSKLGLYGNSFKSTVEVAKSKGYTPIVHTGNLILLKDEFLNIIKFDKNLIKNPDKLFIYDWVDVKNTSDHWIIKFLKFLIPNFLKNKINSNLKYKFLKLFKQI